MEGTRVMPVFYNHVPALISIVAAAIGFFALAILGMIVYIRARTERQTRREKAWMERWYAYLAGNLVDASPPRPLAFSRRQLPSFVMAWNRFMEDITGETEANLIELGYRMKLHIWAQKKLRSGSLFERGLAMLTLGNLGDRSQWSEISRIAQFDDSVLGYLACRALVRIDTHQAAPLVIPVLIHRSTWPAEWRAMLLKEIGAEAIEPFLSAEIEKVSAEILPGVLDFISLIPESQATAVISRFLTPDQDPEVLAAALRALKRSGGQKLLPRVKELLRHPYWPVRVQAVAVLGNLAQRDDVSLLLGMLSDENWWVRFRAAEGLVKLPFMTREAIEALKQQVEDRYGRDILEECIREREAYDPAWQ